MTDFSGRLPGRTGSNPKDRGDYDTEGMACIALADADELLHRWVVLYNLAFHQGIRDIPERLWLEKTAELEVAPIDDIGMLDIVLGEYAIRTPTNKGIFLAGLRYGDLGDNRPVELIRTRAGAANLGKVRIRFDRNDLSHIWLQDPLTKEYHCVASLDPQYTSGLTLAQHRMIRRYAVERAGKYVSIHELCVGRDELQRRISAMCGDEGVTARRAVAMYNGIGSKGSWADFYRMAEAEYGKDRNENMTRSIARLLEAEIDDEIPGGIPVASVKGARPAAGAYQAAAQPAGEDTVAEPMPEPAREQPAVEPEVDEKSRVAALRKRMSDLGTDVEGL